MLRFLALAPAIATAGPYCCMGRPPLGRAPQAEATTCGAEKAGPLIGKRRADVSAADAQRLTGARMVVFQDPNIRVNGRGIVFRLNLEVGEDGLIKSAWCG